jgi:hypothetical protein
MGYPVINFFPSEYLYLERDGNRYCLAADKNSKSDEILFGSTLIRQNNIVFDVSNRLIGIARAKCNEEPTMIESLQDYIDYGNTFGLNVP